MAIIEKNLEMRGMSRKEIIEYFTSISKCIAGSRFYWHDCTIDVSEESKIELGSIFIPVTKVLFMGEEEPLERLISQFRLKFLSAGG